MLRQKPPEILVVQNDDLWRYWAVNTLRQAGAHVESFSTAAQAFQHLEANAAPDMVLVDIQVPDLDALCFARAMKELRAANCQEIPALALSAMPEPTVPAKVIETTGASAFLKLPCHEGLLLNLADMLLHGSRPSG